MITKEEILTATLWRHACKEFDPVYKISDEDFNFLLEIIQLSPSSFGLQPYEIFVLQNKNLLQKLHPYMWGAQKQLFTASHVVMFATKKDVTVNDDYYSHIVIDVQKTPADMITIRKKMIQEYQANEIHAGENREFLIKWAVHQSYIALGNLMTTAAMIKIDSCAIEGFVRDEVTNILVKEKIFDIKKYYVAVFCCLGKRLAEPPRRKTRKPLNEPVHYCQ